LGKPSRGFPIAVKLSDQAFFKSIRGRYMMMFPDIFQAFILGLFIFLPVCLIYRKAGFHPAWAALVFLPVFGMLLIFLQLALLPWPNRRNELECKP
jgi:hypothetical protein